MYAETELMYPYFQNFSQEVQQFEDFGCSQKPNAFSGSAVSDYNLWGEGDLFNAPSLVVEEPVMGIDLMSAAISMISCGEDVMSTQSLTVSDIESGQLLSEVFYECRKDIMAKEGNETPLSEVLCINIPNVVKTDESPMTDEKLGPIQKSASLSCPGSMEHRHEAPLRPSFLDFPVMDLEAVNGMRRAFSEGDMEDRAGSLILSFYDRHSQWRNLGRSTRPMSGWRSYLDIGARNRREILAGRSSMLAGKLWRIANREFVEDLQRLKKRRLRKGDNWGSYEEEWVGV